jgi:3-dehydroquinate dehydratase-1
MSQNSIGSLSVGGVPRVVGVLAGDPREFPALAADARAQGADILEFRADFCFGQEPKTVLSLVRQVKQVGNLPILLTVRQFPEGGYFAGSERERLDFFRCLLPEVAAVDVELYAKEIRDEVIHLAHATQKLAIVSYHNFKHTPRVPKLREVIEDAIWFKADMVKIAVMATTEEDVKSLTRFTADFDGDILLTAISMGEAGTVSRVLNPFLGSCFTYGFIGNKPSTPGQIQVTDLRRLIDAFPSQRIANVQEAEELVHSAFEHCGYGACVPA